MILFRNKLILNDTTLSADKPYSYFREPYRRFSKNAAFCLPVVDCIFHNNANLMVREICAQKEPLINLYCFGAIGWTRQKFPLSCSVQLCGQDNGVVFICCGTKEITLLRNVNINSGYVGVYMNSRPQSATRTPC